MAHRGPNSTGLEIKLRHASQQPAKYLEPGLRLPGSWYPLGWQRPVEGSCERLGDFGYYPVPVGYRLAGSCNFKLFGYNAYIPAGTTFMGKTTALPIQGSNQIVLGTPDITLMPKLICNPGKGLHANQFVNGACFSPTETPGEQGNYIFPQHTWAALREQRSLGVQELRLRQLRKQEAAVPVLRLQLPQPLRFAHFQRQLTTRP